MMYPSNKGNKDYYRSFLKTDRAVLLIAMLIAALAWGISKLSREYVYTKDMDVKYLLPDNYTFSSIPHGKVTAQIEGTGWSLIRFMWSHKMDSIEIELVDKNEQINASLAVRNMLLQAGFDQLVVSAVYPDGLRPSLSEKIRKKVVVVLVGRPVISPNFIRRGYIQILPDSIEVSGPRELVAPFESWPTDTLNLLPLRKSRYMTIFLQSSPNPLVTIFPNSVQLVMEVEPITEKQLNIPIEVPDSLKGRIKIFPDEATVTITAGISRYDELNPSLFSITANADIHASGTFCEVTLQKHPDFVQTVQFLPKEVEFFILN